MTEQQSEHAAGFRDSGKEAAPAAFVVRRHPRRHPNLFTAAEAAIYLGLDDERQLETLRKDFGLAGYRSVGKGFRYWRDDLDATALRMVGRGEETKKMRLAR